MKKLIFLIPLMFSNIGCSNSKVINKQPTVKDVILQDHYDMISSKSETAKQCRVDDYFILRYYGNFRGAYVCNVYEKGLISAYYMEYYFHFDDITLTFNDSSYVPLVWKNHEFYHIYSLNEQSVMKIYKSAWDEGILTYEDILAIQALNGKNADMSELDEPYQEETIQ